MKMKVMEMVIAIFFLFLKIVLHTPIPEVNLELSKEEPLVNSTLSERTAEDSEPVSCSVEADDVNEVRKIYIQRVDKCCNVLFRCVPPVVKS